MKKINKITDITLIFILMLSFGMIDAGYAANDILRIPIGRESTLERAKESYALLSEHTKADYEQEKRIAAIKGVGMLLEEAKAHFSQTGQKLLACLGGGTNVWDHYISEIISRKAEIAGFIDFTVSSEESRARLENADIEVSGLDKVKSIDILIDGVDEVTKDGIGIKGGGGCVLLEKKAITIAKKIWISAESKKLVDALGEFWLPFDIKEDKKEAVEAKLIELGAAGFKVKTDSKGQTFRPDNGPDRIILNADFSGNMINDPVSLAVSLEVMKDKGLILEHGICFSDTRPDILLIGKLGAPDNVQMFYPSSSRESELRVKAIREDNERDIGHLWDVKKMGIEALSPQAREVLYNPDKAEWMKNFSPMVFYELYVFLYSPRARGFSFLKERPDLFNFGSENEHEALGDFLKNICKVAISKLLVKDNISEIEATYRIQSEANKWLKERTGPKNIFDFGQGDEHALTGNFGHFMIGDYIEKSGKPSVDEWLLVGLGKYYILRGEIGEAIISFKAALLMQVIGRKIVVSFGEAAEKTRKEALEYQKKGAFEGMAFMSSEEIGEEYAKTSSDKFNLEAVSLVRKELTQMQKEGISGVEQLTDQLNLGEISSGTVLELIGEVSLRKQI